MGLFKRLFPTYSEKQIKEITPTVDKIEALADAYAAMSDEELRGTTDILRQRLRDGQTLDDILPDAFALVREADWRVLGKRPYRVQLIGGILLHQGRIAEMKTGEGKTLVETLPAYLNALSGRGVHIVTVNSYLAERDSEEMGRVYAFLGLTTGLVVPGLSLEDKQKAYNADITYGTNNEFGFDYLRDNMALYKEATVQRGHAFAIIDEVDSILIDEARTPLIISGQSSKSTDLYEKADMLARTLTPYVIKEIDAKKDLDLYEEDYVVDEKAKTAVLTSHGIEKAEKFFGVENLSDSTAEARELHHHVITAIKAHGVMKRDVDYIVKDGEVIIVDTFTGRLMPGRRYNNGLHQAIEAKEGVEVQKESRTIATITFQNYFRLYSKLSGMTGTALTEEDEFKTIYALDVVEVPTNRPMIRKDHNDAVYTTLNGKYRAIIEQIRACHEKGQPVLVGTVDINKSEQLHKILTKVGIPHNVLNAKHHEREAEIVAQAGAFGAVTISTNMAGRGTDIMLGGNPEFLAKRDMRRAGFDEEVILSATGSAATEDEEILAARAEFKRLYEKHREALAPEAERVKAAGGLYILGTERHESRRIDNQLRGRAGRQGDPGESRFFLSLEDDLMRLFGATDRIQAMVTRLGMTEDTVIDAKILSGSIESAQRRIESQNFDRRKSVLNYDDVMNQQRKVIYKQRQDVLFGESVFDTVMSMMQHAVGVKFEECFSSPNPSEWRIREFTDEFRGLIKPKTVLECPEAERGDLDIDLVKSEVLDSVREVYAEKERICSEAGVDMREFEKALLLHSVDTKWMDHLEMMDDLKEYVGLNSYAQRDPIAMYRIESADMFDQMIEEIKVETGTLVLLLDPRRSVRQRKQVVKVTSTAGADTGEAKKPVVKGKKVGRNDPCPCGSGKKYKKCCGEGA
ncbi:MAG: preprotein translocase subunit SecA [Clostridia bacterium]|nr:preprotein translocase subunit SecA [Clostridia bacterium]